MIKLKTILSELKLYGKITPEIIKKIYFEIYENDEGRKFDNLDFETRMKFYRILNKYNSPTGIFKNPEIFYEWANKCSIKILVELYKDLIKFKSQFINY